MSQKLGIGKIVLILLLVSIGFTSAAQPQDNTVVSYIQSGQVVHRTRRPSGGVNDYLPHSGDEILVRFEDTASSTARFATHNLDRANTIRRFRRVRNLESVKLPILDFLARFNAEVTPFGIVNTIKVITITSDEQLIYLLAPLPTLKFARAITVFLDGQPETNAEVLT